MRLLTLWLFLNVSTSAISQEDSLFKNNIKVIDEITVSANSSIIFDHPNFYLLDFHIDSAGAYVLLKKNNMYLLSKLNNLFEMESNLLLPFKAIQLHRNCLQDLYIIAKDSVYQVAEGLPEVEIYKPNPITFYEEYFLNCQLETNDHLVFRHLFRSNQIAQFDAVNQENSSKKTFYFAYDSMEVQTAAEWEGIMRSEGIDPNKHGEQLDIALILMKPEVFQKFTFYENVITKEDYNPMFRTDSSIHLFNHYIDSIVYFNPKTFLIESQKPIAFHKIKGWQKQILLDPATGIYYTLYQNNGSKFIAQLSSDFEIVRSRELKSSILTKRLMIYKGFLYYDTKESFESSFNQLQRMRL